MGHEPQHHVGVDLALGLPGGLRVVVTGPSSLSERALELLSYISRFEPGGGAGSEASFELVSGAHPTSLPAATAPLETREQIRRSLPVCPNRLLRGASRLCGSSISGEARIERAWLAGSWARAVRDGRVVTPNSTVGIDLRSRFYAVVRASGLDRPTIFRSSRGYWSCVGNIAENDSVSHSFPSELEARVYLEAAGEPEPEFAP